MATTTTKHDVRFIGVCGPSASGKSTVVTRVAAAVKSPIISICADWYFKPVHEFKSCFAREYCWEQPSSLDSALLVSQLKYVADILGTADKVPSITIKTSKGREMIIDAAGFVGSDIPPGTIYVVVEGFLLFADPQLVAMLSHGLWLDMDELTGAKRRFLREGRPGLPEASNPNFEQFYNHTYKHINKHYDEHRDLQLSNIGSKLIGRIDVSPPKDEVADRAIKMLNAALGEAAVRDAGLTVAAFGNAFSDEKKFMWIRPIVKAGTGGHWWLSPNGMHEVRTAGKRQTPESPSCVEMVGRSNFVMWHYMHVYMLDEENGCVFVYTGKEEGITHVARAHGAHGAEPELGDAAAKHGEKPLRFHRAGVHPSGAWFGPTWHWDGRGGLDGEWSFNPGPEFVITEKKRVGGDMKVYHHRAIFLTPTACFLPKFGHLYLLDAELDSVQIWNGKGLNYRAVR